MSQPIDEPGEVSADLRRANTRGQAWLRWLAPLAVGATLLIAWEITVRVRQIPEYLLPAPSAIARTIANEWPVLSAAWLVTLKTMVAALTAAVVTGVAVAAIFASSQLIETSFFPFAVMLQVTPLVAIAPFIGIWLGWERVWLIQLVCAWIVAFFPILSGTAIGLRSADRGLRDLFDLYGATRWQKLRLLLAPSALPYFLAGLKVSVNLSLVGAVVAEFVIGPQTSQPGIASTIFESQLRSNTPMMFAALALIAVTGIIAYLLTEALSRALLARWHESYAAKN